MNGKKIQLRHVWTIGERLNGGGFGQVWTASSPDVEVPAVAKLVPKSPGAQRELLFVDLGAARNVVPVLDSGETEGEYALVMERAEKSLREHLGEHGTLSESETTAVLRDIIVALEDLDGRVGRVVHRDLKPENVLLLDGIWCLCDFGISRYAEVTTAEDTRKYAMTPPYAAPEQWRFERVTNATDIYALGILAHEMLSGAAPFPGVDYRDEHLHDLPPALTGVSGPLASLITECLNKAPGARPSARDVGSRLTSLGGAPLSPGLEKLQQAHHKAVVARAEQQTRAARAESESEQRGRLFEDAQRGLELIVNELQGALAIAAPSIASRVGRDETHELTLGNATLQLSSAHAQASNPIGIPFAVVAYADLGIHGQGTHDYRGRSHSLWYCDAEEEGALAGMSSLSCTWL
jgi:serine/threonine protein kinase